MTSKIIVTWIRSTLPIFLIKRFLLPTGLKWREATILPTFLITQKIMLTELRSFPLKILFLNGIFDLTNRIYLLTIHYQIYCTKIWYHNNKESSFPSLLFFTLLLLLLLFSFQGLLLTWFLFFLLSRLILLLFVLLFVFPALIFLIFLGIIEIIFILFVVIFVFSIRWWIRDVISVF